MSWQTQTVQYPSHQQKRRARGGGCESFLRVSAKLLRGLFNGGGVSEHVFRSSEFGNEYLSTTDSHWTPGNELSTPK